MTAGSLFTTSTASLQDGECVGYSAGETVTQSRRDQHNRKWEQPRSRIQSRQQRGVQPQRRQPVARVLDVGDAGTGTFTQSGGTSTIGYLYVG